MSYYSYKYDEVINLEYCLYQELLEAMFINQGRDKLAELEIVSYPKMKKESAEKVFKKYNKIAYPRNFERKNIVKFSDIKKVLS